MAEAGEFGGPAEGFGGGSHGDNGAEETGGEYNPGNSGYVNPDDHEHEHDDEEGNGGGGGPLDNVFDTLAAAAAEARGEINKYYGIADGILVAANAEALAYLDKGMEDAAKAVIQAAEKSAAAILESGKLADAQVREFWLEAKSTLAPIIARGNFAGDERASMLGIPDSSGNIRPFNAEDLRNTPGYKFQEEQGRRTLENSAVGNYLSGDSARSLVEYGQKYAESYFDKRLAQLFDTEKLGAGASTTQAGLATDVGATLGGLAEQRGINLATIYGTEGANLSNIAMSGNTNKANTVMQTGGARASLASSTGGQHVSVITGLATAGANLSIAQMNNETAIEVARLQGRSDSRNSAGGILGNAFGMWAGAGFPGISDINLKENIQEISTTAILQGVLDTPVYAWSYKDAAGNHIGPMAQDFHAAFKTGTSDKVIPVVDMNGVAMASIQAINDKLEKALARIDELEGER